MSIYINTMLRLNSGPRPALLHRTLRLAAPQQTELPSTEGRWVEEIYKLQTGQLILLAFFWSFIDKYSKMLKYFPLRTHRDLSW